jgi:hypothetical protein
MKHWILFLLLAFLMACKGHQIISTEKYVIRSEISDPQNIQIHSQKGFSDNWMSYLDDIEQFVVSYPADYPQEKPIFMSGMSINRTQVSCSSSITGASKTIPLEQTQGEWGKADWWDGYGHEGWEWPANWENILCTYEGTPPPNSVYAFCSEQNGKTVVICISQMTDNPELAEEIFSTFRWTE